MRTTLLNPTVWLLIAVAITAAVGALRRWDARRSLETVLQYATAWPVLMALIVLATIGIGSRAVLGYLSPGAYAEEVVAARTFLADRQLYSGNSRTELAQWMQETAGPAPPWAGLPGLDGCQVNAMTNRARFFTNHAHTPMLLLAGVPIVGLGGGHALYLCLLALSVAGVICMAAVAMRRAGVAWRSRQGLLIVAAVAGWQPVLAGVRGGDAVLPAAGLVAVAWYLVSRNLSGRAALAAAVASCFAMPAAGVLPALARSVPRAAAVAVMIFLGTLAATVAVAGAGVVPGFLQTAVDTATTYAYAPTNYAVAPRLSAAGAGSAVLIAALALALLCSWWRGRTIDHAFAAFVTLGLLVAPVVWSQHLALLFVPAAVILMHIWEHGSSAALAAWAILVFSFSLPDPAILRFGALVQTDLWTLPLPIMPFALVGLWAWTLFSGAARKPLSPTVADAVGALR